MLEKYYKITSFKDVTSEILGANYPSLAMGKDENSMRRKLVEFQEEASKNGAADAVPST